MHCFGALFSGGHVDVRRRRAKLNAERLDGPLSDGRAARMAGSSSSSSVASELKLDDAECELLLESVIGVDAENLQDLGLNPLTAGFANRVYETSRRGQRLIVKCYTPLVFLRSPPEVAGCVDAFVGLSPLGPRVLFHSMNGLVSVRIPGRTLEEADVHCLSNKLLLQEIAQALGRLHGFSLSSAAQRRFFAGFGGANDTVLWRTTRRMASAAAQRPNLLPPGFPAMEVVIAEIEAAVAALGKKSPKIVFGHGDFKPSNIIESDGKVTLIDFELGGPNFRGFDLMKIFRTDGLASEDCIEYFVRAYLEGIGEENSAEAVADVMKEARMFEPLTWLEATMFFLALPQFKPDEVARWHDLAVKRWARYLETRHLLFGQPEG